MTTMPVLADLNLAWTWPVVGLALGATLLLVADLFVPRERKQLTAWLALAILVVAFLLNLASFTITDSAFFGMFVVDPSAPSST